MEVRGEGHRVQRITASFTKDITRLNSRSRKMRASVSKGDRILDSLVKRGKLTENGRAAFIVATDPFHDSLIDRWRGWPDQQVAPSVCRTIRSSLTVKSTGDGHSIVISTNPILSGWENGLSSRQNLNISTIADDAATNLWLAPMVIEQFSSTNFIAGSRTASNYISIDDVYCNSIGRLCGWGIEVQDVTAEIYKQGTMTIIQLPETAAVTSVANVGPLTWDSVALTQTAVAAQQITRYPSNYFGWLEYEGSRQWAAARGCYMVMPFMTEENPPLPPQYKQPWYTTNALVGYDHVGTINGDAVLFPHPLNSVDADAPVVFPAHVWVPMGAKAVALTGLNTNSTFTITVVWYLETFPERSQEALITLARPSASPDAFALQMITDAMQVMPIAVPVVDNGLGEWFLDVVETIAPIVAPLIGGALGGPAGAALGEAAGMAATGAIRTARKQQRGPASPNTQPLKKPTQKRPQRASQPKRGKK